MKGYPQDNWARKRERERQREREEGYGA